MKFVKLIDFCGDLEGQFKNIDDWEVLMEVEPFAKITKCFDTGKKYVKLTNINNVLLDFGDKKVIICHSEDV